MARRSARRLHLNGVIGPAVLGLPSTPRPRQMAADTTTTGSPSLLSRTVLRVCRRVLSTSTTRCTSSARSHTPHSLSTHSPCPPTTCPPSRARCQWASPRQVARRHRGRVQLARRTQHLGARLHSPRHARAIDVKLVLKRKRDRHGEITKYKARLVLRGDQCDPYDALTQLYTPVACIPSFRLMCSIAAEHDYELNSLDFTTAFLNADCNTTVYAKQASSPRESSSTSNGVPDGVPHAQIVLRPAIRAQAVARHAPQLAHRVRICPQCTRPLCLHPRQNSDPLLRR